MRMWLHRIGWFVALWAMGVVAVVVLSYIIRAVIL